MDVVLTRTQIALTFRDNGAPFDPLSADDPDLDAHIHERAVGGLGLHLIRQTAAGCEHEYIDGFNVLRIHLLR